MLKTSDSFSAASVGAVATKLVVEVCPVNGNTVHTSRNFDAEGVDNFWWDSIAPLPPGSEKLKTSTPFSTASVGAVATKLGGKVWPVNGNTAHTSGHCDSIGGRQQAPKARRSIFADCALL